MIRPARTIFVLLALGVFASCTTQTQRRVDRNLSALGKNVGTAASSVGDGLSAGWDATKQASQTLYDAATSLDAARNGCSLEERDDYEIGSVEEYYLGRALAAEHIADLKAKNLDPSDAVSQYVDRVGQYLAVAAEVYGEQNVRERWLDYPEKDIANRPAPLTGYHFIVLKRAEPNAFGGPGGAVLITTGLLAQLQSEDELAAVLSHEIAHVQRGHGVEFVKAFMCQQGAQDKLFAPQRAAAAKARELKAALPKGSILHDATDEMLTSLMDAVSDKGKALYTVGYPRGFELEADRIGLRYMQLAGYDPDAMTRLFERMKKDAKGDDDYGVTHPKFDKRLAVIQPVLATIPRDQRPSAEDVAARQLRFKAAMSRLPAIPKTVADKR